MTTTNAEAVGALRAALDVDGLSAALDRFLEAADRIARATARARAIVPLERRLHRAVARVFAVQQAGVLRRLAPLAPDFPSEVREAVSLADLERVLDAVFAATRRLFVRAVQPAAEEATLAGAQASGIATSFTLEHPRAVAFLRDYGASRVTAIDETTRAQVRAILVRATDEGWAYGRTAKAIADYFIDLRAEPPTRGEGKATRSRARLIAVTEVGHAYEAGNLLAAQALEDDGTTMEKSWLTAGDARVSDGCRRNGAAGWIPLGDAFPSGDQRPLRHPGCRCALLTRVAP